MEPEKITYYPIAINRLSCLFGGLPKIILAGVDSEGNITIVKHPKRIKK
jgi:hypothetical protein